MIAFAFAVFFMIATPGPAVLALAGVGAAYSFKVGLKFLIGLTIGYLSVWALVITGFASVIFSIPVMRTIFLFIASGYLVYLSLKIMFRGSEIAFVSPQKEPTTYTLLASRTNLNQNLHIYCKLFHLINPTCVIYILQQ